MRAAPQELVLQRGSQRRSSPANPRSESGIPACTAGGLEQTELDWSPSSRVSGTLPDGTPRRAGALTRPPERRRANVIRAATQHGPRGRTPAWCSSSEPSHTELAGPSCGIIAVAFRSCVRPRGDVLEKGEDTTDGVPSPMIQLTRAIPPCLRANVSSDLARDEALSRTGS